MTLAPSQGLANFEKLLNKLEQALPKAITELRKKAGRNNANNATNKSNRNDDDDDDANLAEHQPSAIDIVTAIIDCIKNNYVDDACAAPPSNVTQVKGITAREAMSTSYRQLVDDFVRLRDRWARAANLPPLSGSAPSSRASSSRASSIARRGGSQQQRRRTTMMNDDDDDDDKHRGTPNHQQRHGQQMMMMQQEEEEEQLPPGEKWVQPRGNKEEYQHIGEAVRSVRDLHGQLNEIVNAQQAPLDTVEKNVDVAAVRVENGRKELFAALKHTTVGAGLAGGILGAVVGGPAGFFLGAQSAMAIAASVATGGLVGAYGGTKIATTAQDKSADAEWNRNTIPGTAIKKLPDDKK